MENSLELPLPPSVNRAFTNNRWNGRHIYSQESRDWFEQAGLIANLYRSKNKIQMVNGYIYVDLYFHVRSWAADSHNYLKLLMDLLEKCSYVSNDKFLLPRIQKIDKRPQNPSVEIVFRPYS